MRGNIFRRTKLFLPVLLLASAAFLTPFRAEAGAIRNVIVTSNYLNARVLAIFCQRETRAPVIILPVPWSPAKKAYLCLPDGGAPTGFPAGELTKYIVYLNPVNVVVIGRKNVVGTEAMRLIDDAKRRVNNDISLATWENNAMAATNYFDESGIEREFRAWKKRSDAIPDPVRNEPR